MNKSDLIKLKIEKLKDEKENLKFGYSTFSNAWFAIVIFLATTCIVVSGQLEGVGNVLISVVIFLSIIGISYLGFNRTIQDRHKKLDIIAKEIKKLYAQLKIT
jgi:malate/lactate dehydrogenase